MRKIDKTKILSTNYKTWEEDIERSGNDHPNYISSATRREHYIDVVMNLLHIQEGLCAYTEMSLCSNDQFSEENWEDGNYSDRNPQILGQLDHFNPELKATKGWLWDNFFFIESDINTKVKGKQTVDDVLKPDRLDYDENELFEYDSRNHIFIANTDLAEDLQERINVMILKLGINFDPVIDKRKEYLNDKLKMKKFGLDFDINQFPTAFKMCS